MRSFVYGLAALSGVAAAIVFLLGPGDKALFIGTSQQMAALATPDQITPRPTKGALLILGDSHAGHYRTLAANVSAKFQLRYTLLSNGATAFPTVIVSTPAGGLTLKQTLSNAAEADARAEQEITALDAHETNLIILSSFYRFYFETPLGVRKNQVLTHYDAAGQPISVQNSLNVWLDKLKSFANKNQNSKIVIFLSTSRDAKPLFGGFVSEGMVPA